MSTVGLLHTLSDTRLRRRREDELVARSRGGVRSRAGKVGGQRDGGPGGHQTGALSGEHDDKIQDRLIG